jgi:putative resolvase
MDQMYRLAEAAAFLGVHPVTLRKWSDEGRIQSVRLGKERRFAAGEIRRLRGEQNEDVALLYGRVSGPGQKEDLQRQLDVLRQWSTEQYPSSKLLEIKDVGSGLNPNRKGLAKLLTLVQQRQVRRIVLTYQERLARFGFEYLAFLCHSYGVEIVVLNQQEEVSPEQELVEDMLAIVTSLAGRLYGLRSGKTSELVECVKTATSVKA